MIKEVRDVLLKNKHFILKVMTNNFYVSSYVLTNTYRNLLSTLTYVDNESKKELKRICYIIEQLEKIPSLLASNIMIDMNNYYVNKYGFIINDGIKEDRIRYVLFELLRNAFVHAHNYDYTKKISIGWNFSNYSLKIYVGDEKGGWTQNKLFFKLGISRFIDEIRGKKKQLVKEYL